MNNRIYEIHKRIMKQDCTAIDDIKTLDEAKQIISMMTNNIFVGGKLFYPIGKWVAYRKDGMRQVLHGKVTRTYTTTFGTILRVKRKNACEDGVSIDEVVAFFDDKKTCYNVR